MRFISLRKRLCISASPKDSTNGEFRANGWAVGFRPAGTRAVNSGTLPDSPGDEVAKAGAAGKSGPVPTVDLGVLHMQLQSQLLGEVEIKGAANPVTIRQDTIEIVKDWIAGMSTDAGSD